MEPVKPEAPREQTDQPERETEVEVTPGVTITDSNPREGQALKSDVEAAKDASTKDQDNPRVIVG